MPEVGVAKGVVARRLGARDEKGEGDVGGMLSGVGALR